MNRFEEYFNGLDTKNIIMLYISVIIAAGVVWYNYNYSVLESEIEANNAVLNKKPARHTYLLRKKLVILKKTYKKLEKQQISLGEDLKYLNLLIKTSDVLSLSDEKILSILNQILQCAVDNDIAASYKMNVMKSQYNKYMVEIDGTYSPKAFKNFYNFIKEIEKIKAIKSINSMSFEKNSQVDFKITIVFWGF